MVVGNNPIQIMAILNLTPDSFYDGGKYKSIELALTKVEEMLSDGADIIDIGAVSTKPFADDVDCKEEISRLIPVLREIRKEFPDAKISIDTFRSEVLEECLTLGIQMVNDISYGKFDNNFLEIVAMSRLPYILMHMQGSPQDMQKNPTYNNVVLDVLKFMDKSLRHLMSLGIHDVHIDPGFGFGKTLMDNYALLSSLNSFKIFEKPILVGISRKSMIYKPFNLEPQTCLPETTALHLQAIINGANVLRVHDVSEAKNCIQLARLLTGEEML